MANMSYCRFRNTKIDMMDCINALDDYESLDYEEYKSCVAMFRMVADYMWQEGLIGEIDEEAWDDWEQEIKNR